MRVRKTAHTTIPKIFGVSVSFSCFKKSIIPEKSNGGVRTSGSSEFPAMNPARSTGRPLQQNDNNGSDNDKQDKPDDGQVAFGIILCRIRWCRSSTGDAFSRGGRCYKRGFFSRACGNGYYIGGSHDNVIAGGCSPAPPGIGGSQDN